MLSKLTINAFHNMEEGAIWDTLVLPEGYDKEIVVNEILRQAAEFSLVYPDYEFMKYQIGIWSRKYYHNFDRWIKAYNFDYEALYNVDVITTTTDNAKDTDNDLKHFDMKRWNKADGKTSDTSKLTKAAYDASSLQPISETSSSESNSLSTSASEYHSESNSHSWDHSQTITEIKQGNQGITMSQEMLLAEYNAWRNNIYVMVAELFVSEFCICIYQ